jgi:hypothetical protein
MVPLGLLAGTFNLMAACLPPFGWLSATNLALAALCYSIAGFHWRGNRDTDIS